MKFLQGQKLSQLLIWVLILELGLGQSILALASQVKASPTPPTRSLRTLADFQNEAMKSLYYGKGDARNSPLADFVAETQIPEIGAHFETNDPILDHDPFFLRSQSWSDSNQTADGHAETDEPSLSSDASGVQVQIAGTNKVWHLNQSLRAIGSTEEYVFLTASSADFFTNKGTLDGAAGEGLFVVPYESLVGAAQNAGRVPVFFFPMPGNGWTGDRAFEVLESDTPDIIDAQKIVAVTDAEGVTLPLLLADVTEMVKAQTVNLTLAMGLAIDGFSKKVSEAKNKKEYQEILKRVLENQKESPGSMNNLSSIVENLQNIVGADGELLPPSGSTAGFGIIYTGTDLDNPENTDHSWATDADEKTTSLFKGFFERFGLISVAHADEPAEHTSLARRMIRWGIITSSIMALSIGLKYTYFHKDFKAKRLAPAVAARDAALAQLDKDITEGKFPGLDRTLEAKKIEAAYLQNVKKSGGAVQAVKEILDINAHLLTVFSQIAPVWFANTIEYFGDRFMPAHMSANNTLIRKALGATIYFVRDNMKSTPVNWKTFLYGSVVYGMWDSANVAFQLVWLIPKMAFAAANVWPEPFGMDLKGRVFDAFGAFNGDVRSIRDNEIIRNFASYWMQGASSIQTDLASQIQDRVKREVREEMIRENLDPVKEPDKFEKRVEAKVKAEFRRMGFGGDEVLFDAVSWWKRIQSFLGVELSAETKAQIEKKKEAAKAEGKEFEEPVFFGINRPGLLQSSLKLAIKNEKNLLKLNPDDAEKQASLTMLRETLTDISVLHTFVVNPAKALFSWNPIKNGHSAVSRMLDYKNAFRRAKQNLIALSYKGDIKAGMEFLPGEWMAKAGNVGANRAGFQFRAAFMSLMMGDKEMAWATPESWNKYHGEAYKKAMGSLLLLHEAEYKDLSAKTSPELAASALGQKYNSERELLARENLIDVIQKARETEAAEKYKPEFSFYAKRQLKQIRALTDEAMKAKGFTLASHPEEWRRTFIYEYAKYLGIFPYFAQEPAAQKTLESKLESKVNEEIEKSKDLTSYMARLTKANPQEAVMHRALLEAQAFVADYTAYVDSDERLDPIHPAQRGRLQKLRQSEVLSKNTRLARFATRVVRIVESPFSPDHARLGFWNEVFRKVPFAFDFYSGNKRTWQRSVTSATATYWFNYAVWGMNLTAAQWTLTQLMAFFIASPAQWLNRLFGYQGWKPMGGLLPILGYATIYSYVTFEGEIPAQLFAGDYIKAFDKNPILTLGVVVGGLLGTLGAAAVGMKVVQGAASVTQWVGSKVYAGGNYLVTNYVPESVRRFSVSAATGLANGTKAVFRPVANSVTATANAVGGFFERVSARVSDAFAKIRGIKKDDDKTQANQGDATKTTADSKDPKQSGGSSGNDCGKRLDGPGNAA